MKNLQVQVKKAFCYKKLFWPFTVWTNCSSDLKHFANFSQSREHFFLTAGQNNFGNKTPLYPSLENLKIHITMIIKAAAKEIRKKQCIKIKN